jgi:hypothetical protein
MRFCLAVGPLLLLTAALCAAACAREDVELTPSVRDAEPRANADSGVVPAMDAGDPPQIARVFEQALCVCASATFALGLAIDTFDSTEAAFSTGQSGARMGVNGPLTSTAAVNVRGSLIASATGLLPIAEGPFQIETDFKTNAGLTITAFDVAIGRDLWVNGDIVTLAPVRVARDLYQSKDHGGADAVVAGGQTLTQDFVVPAPCACERSELVDVGAIVAAGKTANDNRARGVGRDALRSSARLELDCGRYAFEAGQVLPGVQVEARGDVTLFIDGDLAIAGKFGTTLGPNAEMDVFVTGKLILGEGAEVGSIANPAALRFYIGGEGDIAMTGALRFAANLYAPNTGLALSADQETYGAMFVATYQSIANHVIHYDRAIQHPRESKCQN